MIRSSLPRMWCVVLLAIVSLAALDHPNSFCRTWYVGPTRTYTAPTQVMPLVADGDTVLIDSGLYLKDVGVWRANRLVLRCPNGIAHLEAQGIAAARKGIWVIDGDSTYVEGIEFSGCAISEADGSNGAGIRFESHYLHCRHCFFRDNQEGILTGNDTTNVIVIEACEFDHNGVETGAAAGFQHNIYVGHSRSCTITFCYFHRSIVGHEIKSRANRSYILYNYIVDGPDGDGSYSIDLPNGGLGDVVGNIIEKGSRTQNSTVVSYGEEGLINPERRLIFASNTVVTDRQPTTFLHLADGSNAVITNNIFAGATHLLVGPTDTANNVINGDIAFFRFRNAGAFDYHVTSPFMGFDSLLSQPPEDGVVLSPAREYVHPLDSSIVVTPYYVGALPPLVQSFVKASGHGYQLEPYPNPCTTLITIYLPPIAVGRKTNIRIFNAIGQEVYQAAIASESPFRLERGSLPAGVYHYIITSESVTLASGSLVAQ